MDSSFKVFLRKSKIFANHTQRNTVGSNCCYYSSLTNALPRGSICCYYAILFRRPAEVLGRRRGLVVERRTPEREVGVRSSLRSPCCILEQDTFTSQKVLVIPRKRLLRPDMTEKLLTGTLSLNQNKTKQRD